MALEIVATEIHQLHGGFEVCARGNGGTRSSTVCLKISLSDLTLPELLLIDKQTSAHSTPDITVLTIVQGEDGFCMLLAHILQSFVSHPNRDGYNEWIDPTGIFDHHHEIVRNAIHQQANPDKLRIRQAFMNSERQIYIARFVFGVLLDLVSYTSSYLSHSI